MEKETIRFEETLFYDLSKRENKALAQLQSLEETLMARYNAASDPETDDVSVEEFSQWLQAGRAEIEQARAALASITMERELVRQALITSRYREKDNKENFYK